MSPDRAGSVRTTVDGRELTISNLDKVLYPSTGFTKGEMIEYYARIAPVMLAHVRDRPLTMKRFPDGVEGQSFFEKHRPVHAPEWMRSVSVPASQDGTHIEYCVLCDVPSVVWVANLATIELHVPLWRVGRRRTLPAPPDHMVFDLDPGEGTTIVECCRVASLIVEALGPEVTCLAKTSGSKGLQLYRPLDGQMGWDELRDTAHGTARRIEAEHPDLVVSNMRKSFRRGKVLIDWSQNHPVKTTIAPYSLRARPDPTASTPVTWEEVERCADSGDPDQLRFTAHDVLDRVERMGDLFAPVGDGSSA
ncbi:MAG: non-homologous end-joining DNA ligase [Acidimicrobiales bacterium]